MTAGRAKVGPGAVEHRFAVVVSCEHAGNEVPERYAPLFASSAARAALASHRGWDPGSLEIGERLAAELDAPFVVQRVSRLVVECNRSLDHPSLFSEFTRGLSERERAELLERYWRAHRDAVWRLVDGAPPGATLVHVGVHTFTPVWKGRSRSTDVGLLYDPSRGLEAGVARRWRRELVRRLDGDEWSDAGGGARGLRVHLNRPYRGWTDGLTTALRGQMPEARYVGIELEVCQRLVPASSGLVWRIADALRVALG